MTEGTNIHRPEVGQIVKILRGRGQGQYAVVIRLVDERFVIIADGDRRRFDRPKKKNVLHLQLEQAIAEEVVNSLTETGRVSNGKLRFVIQRFVENQSDA